jgi:hypothetical protein
MEFLYGQEEYGLRALITEEVGQCQASRFQELLVKSDCLIRSSLILTDRSRETWLTSIVTGDQRHSNRVCTIVTTSELVVMYLSLIHRPFRRVSVYSCSCGKIERKVRHIVLLSVHRNYTANRDRFLWSSWFYLLQGKVKRLISVA